MRKHHARRRSLTVALLAAVLLLVTGGIVYAAQFEEGEIYRLPAGQVVTDDLYVSAGEIYIDGRVEGDLVAAGGIIEINGEVTQDVLAAGASIVINGTVGDDVRAAAAGITIAGAVADDVLIAGGGPSAPGVPTWPIQINGRTVEQGVRILDSATIGRDAVVAGGTGAIAGTIGRNLLVAMNSVTVAAAVGGDATLYGSQINIADNAAVAGELSYQATNPPVVPAGVAESVVVIPPQVTAQPEQPQPTLGEQLLWWTIGVARALLGLLVFGWLLVKLAPQWSLQVARVMGGQPWKVAGVAVLLVAAFIPLTLLAIGIAWLFWDFFPGVLAVSMFLFGLWGVLWFTSPLFTGYCLGRVLFKGQSSPLLQLFLGALIILLGARILEWTPVVGGFLAWLVMVGSFGYAVAGILLARTERVAAVVEADLGAGV